MYFLRLSSFEKLNNQQLHSSYMQNVSFVTSSNKIYPCIPIDLNLIYYASLFLLLEKEREELSIWLLSWRLVQEGGDVGWRLRILTPNQCLADIMKLVILTKCQGSLHGPCYPPLILLHTRSSRCSWGDVSLYNKIYISYHFPHIPMVPIYKNL